MKAKIWPSVFLSTPRCRKLQKSIRRNICQTKSLYRHGATAKDITPEHSSMLVTKLTIPFAGMTVTQPRKTPSIHRRFMCLKTVCILVQYCLPLPRCIVANVNSPRPFANVPLSFPSIPFAYCLHI